MKELILVRHGKSSWDYHVSDKDRPLLERGINDVILVSQKYTKQPIAVDFVYSSTANRAMHTCMIFLRQLDFPMHKLQLTHKLYDFSGDTVLHFIQSWDDSLQSVMIFGHNHAFTHLANSLGNKYIENVPTSGLVHLQFNTDRWSKIGKGTTVKTIFPKQLK